MLTEMPTPGEHEAWTIHTSTVDVLAGLSGGTGLPNVAESAWSQ